MERTELKPATSRRVKRKRIRPLPFLAMFVLLMSVAVAAYAFNEKEIEIIDNGRVSVINTHAVTVGELLEQRGIELIDADVVAPGVEAKLEDCGRVIIHRAFPVTVTADFETNSYRTQEVTVAEFLQANSIELGQYDWVSPSLDALVNEDVPVIVSRITYRQTETTQTIEPKTVRREDSSLNSGQSKVVTAGRPGELTITNLVTYKDGVPINKQEVSRKVTVAAQDEVVAVGTRQVISRGGKTYAYREVMSMRATAYTHTGNRTYTGTNPRAGYTVAVDPKVIPLGTMLYVDGYGYAKAEDIGSAITGKKIDLFFNSERECTDWGVRNVRVYILE